MLNKRDFHFLYSITCFDICFDLVHVDILGPFSIPSVYGHKHFLAIVDDKSRYCWIYLMKLKFETLNLVKSFVSLIRTHFPKKIKSIRSHNGTKFSLKSFYSEEGIMHQTSCVDTP